VKFTSYYYIRSYEKISTDFVGCSVRFIVSLFLDLLCSYSCSGHFNFFDYIAYLVIVTTVPSLWQIYKLFPFKLTYDDGGRDTFLPSTGGTMEGSVFCTSVLLGVGHVQPYFIVNEKTWSCTFCML
jgi:hypothetical protein